MDGTKNIARKIVKMDGKLDGTKNVAWGIVKGGGTNEERRERGNE